MPFNKHSPYRSSFIILAVILIFVFISPGFFQPLRIKMGRAITVPGGILAAPVSELKKFLLYHQTYEDYQALKHQYETLKSRMAGSEEVYKENARLNALLGLRGQLRSATVTAHVIGRDLSNWESSVLIDKGINDGVRKGHPVVTAAGVVGRVVQASDDSSRVMLLVDPQFSVAGRVKSTQQSVLVSGSLNGQCRIRYAEIQEKIQIGDDVVTSRMSSSFPENLLIGTVTAVHPGPEGSTDFVVKPSVSTSELQEVLIMTGPHD